MFRIGHGGAAISVTTTGDISIAACPYSYNGMHCSRCKKSRPKEKSKIENKWTAIDTVLQLSNSFYL